MLTRTGRDRTATSGCRMSEVRTVVGVSHTSTRLPILRPRTGGATGDRQKATALKGSGMRAED